MCIMFSKPPRDQDAGTRSSLPFRSIRKKRTKTVTAMLSLKAEICVEKIKRCVQCTALDWRLTDDYSDTAGSGRM